MNANESDRRRNAKELDSERERIGQNKERERERDRIGQDREREGTGHDGHDKHSLNWKEPDTTDTISTRVTGHERSCWTY